jgi:hypothetical protein
MRRLMCMEPGCTEMVEVPEDSPRALAEERLPPPRDIEAECANGHVYSYPRSP